MGTLKDAQRLIREAVLEEVRQGGRVKEIAQRYNVAFTTVYNWMNQGGIRRRDSEGRRMFYGTAGITTRTLQILAALINTTDYPAKIARAHSVSRQYVSDLEKRAREAGIVMPERDYSGVCPEDEEDEKMEAVRDASAALETALAELRALREKGK